jgi:hypothetical protein
MRLADIEGGQLERCSEVRGRPTGNQRYLCQKKWYRNMTRHDTMEPCKTILERYLAGFTGMGGDGRFPRSIFSMWRIRKPCRRPSLALLAKG